MNSDADSSQDDVPVLTRRRSQRTAAAKAESLFQNDGNVKEENVLGDPFGDKDDDDSDEDVPLRTAVSKRRQQSKEASRKAAPKASRKPPQGSTKDDAASKPVKKVVNVAKRVKELPAGGTDKKPRRSSAEAKGDAEKPSGRSNRVAVRRGGVKEEPSLDTQSAIPARPKEEQELATPVDVSTRVKDETSVANSTKTEPILKKEKRKFEKAGQRRETPVQNDALRMFYESMYVEKTRRGVRSELAEKWLITHGVLDNEVAERILGERKTEPVEL